MASSKKNGGQNAAAASVNSFRFSLPGLIVFCLSIMAGAALTSFVLYEHGPKIFSFVKNDISDPDAQDQDLFAHTGPWGELLTQNIKLERPSEYISSEVKNPTPVAWTFAGMNPAQIKALLAASGLSAEEVEAQTSSDHLRYAGKDTVMNPDDNFLLSLKPEKRARLYGSLYGKGVEVFIDFPFIFPKDSIETIYNDDRLQPADVAMLKHLVYPAANSMRLADCNLLLRQIPTPERRVMMSKVLSLQPAVLARLRVRPDSDIDKIAAYWGHMENVRFTDIRPMLEALKGLPHGGTISLMYFLPPFARTRLYTYPLPAQPGDPTMDCHWSTFNFSSVQPDNRYNNAEYAVEFIRKNYYRIDSPSIYGDLVLYANERSEIKHSAVFLADDLAFTKYGDNYRQPWMIVRITDMQAMYPTLKPVFYRKKTE